MKLAITGFFLSASFWVTYLIFNRGFMHKGMEFSVDNQTENTFMILLVCTVLSAVAVFFLGLLSMFTHFVFVRLIYADDIKIAALSMLRKRRRTKRQKLQTQLKQEEQPTVELIKG